MLGNEKREKLKEREKGAGQKGAGWGEEGLGRAKQASVQQGRARGQPGGQDRAQRWRHSLYLGASSAAKGGSPPAPGQPPPPSHPTLLFPPPASTPLWVCPQPRVAGSLWNCPPTPSPRPWPT